MTHRVRDTVVICETAPANCTSCGEIKELRPYGKNGAWVCFHCGMKDEDNAKAEMSKLLNGKRDI